MSNFIAKMKRKNERIHKDDIKTVNKSISKNNMVNFKERILPRTLLVDVKTGTLFIGDNTNPIGNCRKLISGLSLEDDIKFVKDVEEIGNENVDKVILDNGDGFKHLSFSEFVEMLHDVIRKHTTHNNHSQKPQDSEQITL